MTISISPGIASQLAAAGTENNPIILWDNQAADGAWTQAQGTEIESPTNLQTPTTYDKWVQITNASGQTAAEVALPEARTFNFMAIAAHNLGDLGITLKPQFSTNGGVNWTSTTAPDVEPTTNEAICFLFDGEDAADWRIRITNGAPQEQVSLGVAFFGTFLQIPQRIYQGYTPPITPTRVDLQSSVSAGANLLEASIIRKGSNMVANLTHLLPAFIRDTDTNGWPAFQSHFNNGGAEFWLWRPTTFGDAFYGWRDGAAIMPTNSGPKSYMAASVEMRLFDNP